VPSADLFNNGERAYTRLDNCAILSPITKPTEWQDVLEKRYAKTRLNVADSRRSVDECRGQGFAGIDEGVQCGSDEERGDSGGGD
jgi:hypothetical protein